MWCRHSMLKTVKKVNWSPIFLQPTVDNAYDTFISHMKTIYQCNFPHKYYIVLRSKICKSQMTPQELKTINVRNNLFKRIVKTKTSVSHCIQTIEKLAKQQNENSKHCGKVFKKETLKKRNGWWKPFSSLMYSCNKQQADQLPINGLT